jgi:hypothetical protein
VAGLLELAQHPQRFLRCHLWRLLLTFHLCPSPSGLCHGAVSLVGDVSDLLFSTHARVRFLNGGDSLKWPLGRERKFTDLTDPTDW